jgi:sterol desaturase/sphingolipid hydroxylase (fatty acid hydroxylase superfamily)
MMGMGEYAFDMLANMAPIALVMVVLAVVTKRDRVFAAFQRCKQEGITNFLLAATNTVFLAPFFAIPTGLAQSSVAVSTGLSQWWLSIHAALPIVVAVLLLDFVGYWRHRFEHSSALWRFHATHHSDEALHWLSVMRKHPVGAFLSLFIDALPLLALGLPIWSIGVALLVRNWWAYFEHADVDWTLGPLGWFMISPAAHRLHHAKDEALAGSNFAGVFTFWDRMFGTYVDPTPHLGCETGIAEGSRSFLGELARPFEGSQEKLGNWRFNQPEPESETA